MVNANVTKPLFSDHYLTRRLQKTTEWNEDISIYRDNLKDFYTQKKIF